MERSELVAHLTSKLCALCPPHTARVAIDGVDAAGKTTLADELARALQGRGRTPLRASIDGFHNPEHVRRQPGVLPDVGYYRDSFNYAALISELLQPLGAGGNGWYRGRVFDFRTDSAIDEPPRCVPAGAILLFDGVFLLRPELAGYWDFSIFVRVDFDETLRRAESRDVALFGSVREVRARYLSRYIPGQRIYLAEVEPERLASIVLDNNEPRQPSILRSA